MLMAIFGILSVALFIGKVVGAMTIGWLPIGLSTLTAIALFGAYIIFLYNRWLALVDDDE